MGDILIFYQKAFWHKKKKRDYHILPKAFWDKKNENTGGIKPKLEEKPQMKDFSKELILYLLNIKPLTQATSFFCIHS